MTITWDRVLKIFGNPRPPQQIWEQQFDWCNDLLRNLCRTPVTAIDFNSLSIYYDDLAYVELQPEVFGYLFPVCLMHWHHSLSNNDDCCAGTSEFHSSVYLGNVFEKMLTPAQRAEVYAFFKDSFLSRLDQEAAFDFQSKGHRFEAWIRRLNSLAKIIPAIDLLWKAWWEMETPGRAIAALQYSSGLIYALTSNPLCPYGTSEIDFVDTFLLGHDSFIFHVGWKSENVEFVKAELTRQFLIDGLIRAKGVLQHHPAHELAGQMLEDLYQYIEFVAEAIKNLPALLSRCFHAWDL